MPIVSAEYHFWAKAVMQGQSLQMPRVRQFATLDTKPATSFARGQKEADILMLTLNEEQK